MRKTDIAIVLAAAAALSAAGCRCCLRREAAAGPKGVSGTATEVYEFCTRISNGTTDVVVAPSSGGRLLAYALDGKNILYRHPEPDPTKIKPGRRIRMLAGRFDIGPEIHPTHKIPRRDLLWRGEWSLKQTGPMSVRITSQKCPATGVQITRELTLDDNSSHLLVRQTMTNVSDKTTRWCFWSRTLAKGGGICMVPLNPKSKFPKGYARYVWGKGVKRRILTEDPEEPRINVVGNLVTLEAVGEKSLKIGCDSDGEWMAYACDGMLFVKRFRYFPGAVYNDALGFSVAVYLTGDMCELEPISPEAPLKPGESYTYDEEWWLLDYPAANDRPLDFNEIKQLVAEQTALSK